MQPARISDYQDKKARDMTTNTDTFTMLPNEFFDYHMPRMKTASEMKVVLVIARKTIGWHKECDCISLSQFVQLTGLNREEVVNGIEAAIKHGSIQREKQGISYVYKANLVGKPDYDISDSRKTRLDKKELDSRKTRPVLVGKPDQLEPLASRKTRHTKETNLNKDLNKDITANAVTQPPLLEQKELTPTTLDSGVTSTPVIVSPPPAKKARKPKVEKTPKAEKPPAPLLDNPAYMLFREKAELKEHLPLVARQAIAEKVTNLDQWEQTICGWLMEGYRVTTIKGLLDWYAKGWVAKPQWHNNQQQPVYYQNKGTYPALSQSTYTPTLKEGDSW